MSYINLLTRLLTLLTSRSIQRQACVQPPTAAVNVTLSAFSVAAPCCSVVVAGRPAPTTVDRYVLPTGHPAANKSHANVAVNRSDRQTDREME